jgi:hypothetical protein
MATFLKRRGNTGSNERAWPKELVADKERRQIKPKKMGFRFWRR